MRITQQMIIDRTIFNLGRNVSRLMLIESRLSTGRRINLPSDDPIGTQHVMNYRTRLKEIEQYKSNINQGLGRMAIYENGLADLKDLFQSAQEAAITMADSSSDSAGDAVWQAEAEMVKSIFEQVLQIANGQNNGRYIYSGHLIKTRPMQMAANGVIYLGDQGNVELGLEPSSRMIANLRGDDIFFKQINTLGEGVDLQLGLDGTTLIADLNLGSGVDLTSGASPGQFQVFDKNLNATVNINLNNDAAGAPAAAPTDINEVVNRINGQLGLAGSNMSVSVSDTGASLKWTAVVPATNSITGDTPLDNLNGGTGVDRGVGKISIRNADSSIQLEVDLSADSTIGEVINSINNALTAEFGAGVVTVGLKANGNGLEFVDITGVLGLIVEDIPGTESMTASDLGITGNIDPTLTGLDLNPIPDIEITDIGSQTTAGDLGLLGDVHGELSGQNIKPLLTIDSPVSSLNNKIGFELGKLKITQGDRTVFVDLRDSALPANPTVNDIITAINNSGLDIVASINSDQTGIQIVPSANSDIQTLIIENMDATDKTAHILGLAGATDMMGSLLLLANSLVLQDQEMMQVSIGNMEKSMHELLNARASVGSKVIRLETTLNRHERTEVSVRRLKSETEDADIIMLVSDLARQENLYQAALLASSKVIQPSLMDFLR